MDEANAEDFTSLPRGELQHRGGVAYRDFRRGLTPRFGIVRAQVGAAHLALFAIGALSWWIEGAAGGWAWCATPLVAFAFGLAVAFLHLFLHEAAHYGLAASRISNDRIANLAIGLLLGQEIRRYRANHFDHHRLFGTPDDTERSYFDRLDGRFVLEGLFGLKVLRVLGARTRRGGSTPDDTGSALFLLASLGFHAGILAGLATIGSLSLAVGWLLGLAAVFPFLAALRQLLEHRSLEAGGDARGLRTKGTHRLFEAGPFSSIFGGAGFNRHLLHHWEPQVPCTRLPELEQFLLGTDAAGWLERQRTTYRRAFVDLWGA